MRNRKHLTILLVIFLVVAMASQAALAFSMPCRGASDCCCTAPKKDMTAAMPGGMDRNCCDATPAQSCDIQTTAPAAAAVYLSSSGPVHGDMKPAFLPIAITIDPMHAGAFLLSHSGDVPDRGSPPTYLQNQSFLC